MPLFLAAVRQLCLLAKLWNLVPSLKDMARDALAFGRQSSLWPRMNVLYSSCLVAVNDVFSYCWFVLCQLAG